MVLLFNHKLNNPLKRLHGKFFGRSIYYLERLDCMNYIINSIFYVCTSDLYFVLQLSKNFTFDFLGNKPILFKIKDSTVYKVPSIVCPVYRFLYWGGGKGGFGDQPNGG